MSTEPQIVVCGEALIDLTPAGELFAAHPGGGPYNTAIALGRLGVGTAFCSRVSLDGFGRTLRSRLVDASVDPRHLVGTNDPTSLAVVTLNEQHEADYQFYVEGTADRGLTIADLPDVLGPSVQALHFGTLSMVLEPAASSYEHLMRREAGRRLIALDPNCRPPLIPDRGTYRERLESWVALSGLVKVSSADLAWLYPELRPAAVAERWQSIGATLVVVTDGSRGAIAFHGPHVSKVPTPVVTVVDTIGAGDTFNAGLLAWLARHDALSTDAVRRLGPEDLGHLLAFAAAAAAITCSRAGADPPWSWELAG